jgi:hypothetical protein
VETGWRYEPDSVAYTTLWVTRDGQILDADIELNDEYFDWSAAGGGGVMDIQNALTHEVGHFIGIGHTVDDIGASMFPIIPDGEVRKRLVKADDLEAAAFLYPLSAAELAVYELSISELVDGFGFAERAVTNYESISPDGRIMLISGMRMTATGESGLGAIFVENGQEVFYIYPGPGVAGEELTARSRDAWEIPGGILKDLTAVDIDGDGADEIAVLRMDHVADHALYVYDRPPDGEFERTESRVWIARDLWRIPGGSDNITVFSLDLNGNGRRELATFTYSIEGVYVINAFTTPRRFDSSREDAMSLPGAILIPFTIDGTVLDIDSIDSNGDGVSEAAALVKSDAGYSVQILPLALPNFPEEVQELTPTATMQLILDDGEYPLSLTVLQGTDLEEPRILVVLGSSDR